MGSYYNVKTRLQMGVSIDAIGCRKQFKTKLLPISFYFFSTTVKQIEPYLTNGNLPERTKKTALKSKKIKIVQ